MGTPKTLTRWSQGAPGGPSLWESPKKTQKGVPWTLTPNAAQTSQTPPQAGQRVTEVARSSASEETPPLPLPPTFNSTNPRESSTARLPRPLQSSTYIRPRVCAPLSGKVSREPIGAWLGAWPSTGGGQTGTMGRSTLGAVGCDWPPLAGAAPRTAAAAAAGGTVRRLVATAALGSCLGEWDPTRRQRAEALRCWTGHSVTGPRYSPGNKRQKSDSGASVREEAAAATRGPGWWQQVWGESTGAGGVDRVEATGHRAEWGRRGLEEEEFREWFWQSAPWRGDPSEGPAPRAWEGNLERAWDNGCDGNGAPEELGQRV